MESKTRKRMKEIKIKVKFEGVVTVKVPQDAPLPEVLAKKIALSRALATVDNPDAPDDAASSEWIDAIERKNGEVDEDATLEMWDNSNVENIAGAWELSDKD